MRPHDDDCVINAGLTAAARLYASAPRHTSSRALYVMSQGVAYELSWTPDTLTLDVDDFCATVFDEPCTLSLVLDKPHNRKDVRHLLLADKLIRELISEKIRAGLERLAANDAPAPDDGAAPQHGSAH